MVTNPFSLRADGERLFARVGSAAGGEHPVAFIVRSLHDEQPGLSPDRPVVHEIFSALGAGVGLSFASIFIHLFAG